MKNTVVIADDSPIYLEILKRLVEMLGFQVHACADGQYAIPYVKHNIDSVAAVILDVYMPHVDGISALGHLKGHFPSLPVIMVTGSDDKDDEKTILAHGATALIKKSESPDHIQEMLQRLLGGARPAQVAI